MWVPKVTVRSARTCGPSSGAAVDVDAGRHVDRDDGHRGEALERRHRVGAEPGATADADDAVHQHVGRRVEGVEVPGRPAAGGAQGGEPRVVHAVGEEQRLDRRAPRAASRAPAHSASPPLSPGPTSSSTRRP